MSTSRTTTRALVLGCLSACALGVQAQSEVKVYGLLDAGIEINRTGVANAGTVKRVNTGNQAGSRLGVSSTEDLGGGVIALANLELGVFNDDGTIIQYGEPKGTYFGRRSVVGLKSNTLGEVVIGRDYTPAFWTIIQSDRFRYGLPGNLGTPSAVVITRANKGIFYTSPNLKGAVVRLAVAAADDTIPRGVYTGGSVDWTVGDLFVSAAAQKRKEPAGNPSTGVREYGAGLEYRPKPYTFNAGFFKTDPNTVVANAIDRSTAYWLGAGMTVGLGQINVQVTKTSFDLVGRAQRGHALTYGVSYTYFLSKTTALYASYGGVNNDDNARHPLNTGSQRTGGAVFGADPSAALVGMRVSF